MATSFSASSSYVACHLCRRDMVQQSAWGMWISFASASNIQCERPVVVGAIQQPTFNSLLQWAWVTSSPPDTSILINQAYGNNLWRSYFSMLPEVSHPSPRTLVAGDMIVSVNGMPISTFGNSISNLMEYLKRCNQLFIVAVRNSSATPLNPTLQRIVEKAQQSALAGDAASSPATTQSLQQNILRVVTPSKADTGATSNGMHLQSYKSQPRKKTCTNPPTQRSIHFPPVAATNPMFRATQNDNLLTEGTPYCDNHLLYDPDEDNHNKDFLAPVDRSNFHYWLVTRKQKWRSKWKVRANAATNRAADIVSSLSGPTAGWANRMFTRNDDSSNADGGQTSLEPIPYCDNLTFDPYDGSCSRQYLVRVDSANFSAWLTQRKQKWRTNWKPYPIKADDDTNADHHQHSISERNESTVRYDFWSHQHSSFDEWLTASKQKWKKSYSWNSRKRKRIQQVCEEVVKFPSSQAPAEAQKELQSWLRVRKNQWKMLRRKRQRRMEEEYTSREVDIGPALSLAGTHAGDYLHIDALLEEEENHKKSRADRKKDRKPEEISFLFLPSLGLSDDIAALCLQFLDCSEHGKLLCVSKSLGEGLQSRCYMWQLLCNRCPHWHLPRRPRKPWYKLYLSKLRTEVFASRKQWDDLLMQVSEVLTKGDQLKLVKKLIEGAEKKFSFTVDYISGVVCERNSTLNLAVIHKRHKVVHWLVEQKNADLETSDRGHFTPLINAAWGGDRHLVRFLLHHKANRNKVGTGHYTQALAPSDFEGLTAEGWARKKGYDDIAELIRVGL